MPRPCCSRRLHGSSRSGSAETPPRAGRRGRPKAAHARHYTQRRPDRSPLRTQTSRLHRSIDGSCSSPDHSMSPGDQSSCMLATTASATTVSATTVSTKTHHIHAQQQFVLTRPRVVMLWAATAWYAYALTQPPSSLIGRFPDQRARRSSLSFDRGRSRTRPQPASDTTTISFPSTFHMFLPSLSW
jgi:hypothetical protein